MTRTTSVCLGMPVYNGEKYVADAIESILRQEFSDFQLIIFDNASTDRTGEICRSFVTQDSRVTYQRNARNLGAAPNFEKAFQACSGDYFKWVVHDDICAPSYLRQCVDVFQAHGDDVVLVYPKTILIDSAGQPLGRYDDRMNLQDARPSARIRRILTDLRLCHCALGLIRTAALAKTQRIGTYMHGDIVMLAQLAMMGRFCEVDEYLYHRRVHSESSFKVNATPQEYENWMDTSRHPWISMPQTRMFYELFGAVRRSSLSLEDKAKCLSHVALRIPGRIARHGVAMPLAQMLGTVLPESMATSLKRQVERR